MKKIISLLLALSVLSVTAVTGYAEENIEDDITEYLSEIFSEDDSVSTQPDETETETTTADNRDPITTPGGYYKGDINLDGYITASDSRTILRFTSKQLLLSEQQCVLADINSNKAVNAQDARLTLRMAAKLDPIKKCDDAASANPDKFLANYDYRKNYTPYLSGFSTNITDESVFSKIRALEDYCYNLGRVATFYYTDVNEEYYISYNSTRIYRTQCTIKAPYIKSMLDYMEANNISLDKVLYLQSNQKWSGHYLSSFRTGTGFTIREIMYYAIRNSDNTAYQMLFDYFGPGVLNRNAEKVGSILRLDTYIFGETSASDMAKLYIDIYNYDGIFKDEFFGNLANSYTTPLIGRGIPDEVTILRKSGSGGNATIGYHDCAIVLTDKPYVLTIYTSINMDRYYDKLPFQRIAEMTYAINQAMNY